VASHQTSTTDDCLESKSSIVVHSGMRNAHSLFFSWTGTGRQINSCRARPSTRGKLGRVYGEHGTSASLSIAPYFRSCNWLMFVPFFVLFVLTQTTGGNPLSFGIAHVTVLEGRRGVRRMYDQRNNAGNTCYKVNNKNIKRTGNPKRRVTSKCQGSESLQKKMS
jgi:hypothetical protein